MPSYSLTWELEGLAHITVEAENEAEAVRKARRLVELGEAETIVDYECVRVTQEGES